MRLQYFHDVQYIGTKTGQLKKLPNAHMFKQIFLFLEETMVFTITPHSFNALVALDSLQFIFTAVDAIAERNLKCKLRTPNSVNVAELAQINKSANGETNLTVDFLLINAACTVHRVMAGLVFNKSIAKVGRNQLAVLVTLYIP